MPSRLAALRSLGAIALAMITSAAFAAESYRFTHRPAVVGDQASQRVNLSLDVSMSMQQAGQVIDATKRVVGRKQSRNVTVLEVDGRHVARARVRYGASEQSVAEADGPPASVEHPVVGKTYLVSRPGGERAVLVVTDEQGRVPPKEELAVVQASMVAVGRTNPWTEFLAGRTLTQGETVRMPNHLAADLLGVGEAVGDVSRFEITLTETRQIRGATCAVLATQIESSSPLGDGVGMLIDGYFLVDIDTCQTLAINLSGEVAISETHGPVGGQFTVEGRGALQVAIEAQYGRAPEQTARR